MNIVDVGIPDELVMTECVKFKAAGNAIARGRWSLPSFIYLFMECTMYSTSGRSYMCLCLIPIAQKMRGFT